MTALDWNNLGWQALFHPPVSEQLLQETQLGIGPNPGFSELHTVAMLYAELGKTTEARDVIWQAMEDAGIEVTDSAVWLVVGRMAEQFGARAAAAAAYEKIEKPRYEDQMAGSNYVLTQQRLKYLRNN